MAEAIESALVSKLQLTPDEAWETTLLAVISICDKVGGAQEYIPRFPVLDGERLVPYLAPWRSPTYSVDRVTRQVVSLRAEGLSGREIGRRLGMSRRQVATHLAKAAAGVPTEAPEDTV